jgi:predicted PurR-regulated permease PerM
VLISAGITAIILIPLDQRLSRLFTHARFRAFLLASLVFVMVVLPLFVLAILVVVQTRDILTLTVGADSFLKNINPDSLPLGNYLFPVLRDAVLALDIEALAKKLAAYTFNNIGAIFASTAQLIMNGFIFFLGVYYFLAERAKIKRGFLTLSPFRDALDERIMSRIVMTVRGTMFGAFVLALVQGTAATIGLLIFGVPGAFLWGTLTIIASQIPLVGVSVIMIPAVLYLFAIGEYPQAIGLLIWSATAVGLSDNVLAPLLIRGRTRMHGLLILISILGGVQLFGMIGFIMGPTILASLLIVIELYKNGILQQDTTSIS